MIRIEKVNFAYHTEPVLKDLNISLEEKTFSTIIGPNGSGKTTLMNLLTKNSKNQNGLIHLKGESIEGYSIENFACMAAVINQNEQIKFPFSCLEVILMGRKPHVGRFGKLNDKDFEIVHEVMELTNTTKFIDTPITEISGGEYQRVMLARALAQEPEVLFLDEAFSAMDLSYKLHFLKLIKNLVDNKRITVVAVMHDLNLAYRFSDCVCILKEGMLKAIGQPKQILTEKIISDVFGVEAEHVPDKGFLFL